MKKQTSIFLVLYFLVAIGFSQEVPKIFPVSPEASSLGKYGDIPINLSTGKINYTIPVYTIQENGLQLPINISYNYSGLLIDEIPGITGLGWSLNAGGLITRQVRGRPDEDTNGYIGPAEIGKNYVVPYIFNRSSLTQEQINYFLSESSLGALDTQPDKFIVNIGGVQANFYFNENKQIAIVPRKPYKIELINNDFSQGFKVTDEKGNQYYFQTKEHSTRKHLTSGFDITATPANGYTTSWKITKIITKTNKEINFSYISHTYYQQFSSDSYVKPIPLTGIQCSGPSLNFKRTYYELNTKILQRITFPKGEIGFDVSTTSLTDALSNYNKYFASLNRITIKDKNQKLIWSYDLTYDATNKTRKLLTKVVINNDSRNSYELSYYGSPSDNILFSKQDFWGYYNNNNTGRLIDYDNFFTPRVPDFNKTKIGALKTIKYPTQGITEIEYEANTYDPGVPGTQPVDDFDSCLNAEYNTSYYANAGIYQNSTNNDVADIKTFNVVNENAWVQISLHVIKNNAVGDVYAGIRKINSTSPSVSCLNKDCNNSSKCNVMQVYYCCGFANTLLDKNKTVTVKLEQGTYELFATAKGAILEPNKYLTASASVQLLNIDPNAPVLRSKQTGGIRVSQTKSCPDNNPNNCITKKYEYEKNNGISNGFLFRRRNLYSFDTEVIGHLQCRYKNYTSSSNVPLGTFFGSHIIYKQVKEYTIDSQGNKNGEKITKFTKSGGSFSPLFPFAELNHYEWYNGKTYSESFINTANDTLRKNKFSYLYSVNNSNNPVSYGLKVGRVITNSGVSPTGLANNNLEEFFAKGISTFDSRSDVDLIKSKTEEIIEGNNKLVSNTNFFYDNPTYLQLTRTETTTSDNKTIITKTSYPDDVTSTGSLGNDPLLTGEKWAIDKLKTQHRIAEPIQVETTVKNANGVQLSKNVQRTNYRDWGNNLVLPQFVQTLKGNYSASNKLQDRLQYKSYYANGNPKELLKKGGSTITYIWGYQEQYPIAKIENVTYAQIASQVTNLQNKSNADNDRTIGNVGNEGALRSALTNLRNSVPANALVTTYTYDPLIGVTSITDPGGNTSYYHYDAFNRLQYIKNKDGEVLKEYKYNYKVPEIVATTTSSATTVTSGQSVTLTTNASGGTGNFTYKWTVSNANLNQVFNTSTGSLTITTTANHAPNFTVTCEVKDTQTQEVMTTTTQVNVTAGFPALVVGNITYTSGTTYVGKNITHTISLSGGSGNYKYSWSKVNNQTILNIGTTTTSSTTNSRSARITSQDCSYYTVRCTVKDLTTNETVVKTKRIFIASGCSSGGGGGIR